MIDCLNRPADHENRFSGLSGIGFIAVEQEIYSREGGDKKFGSRNFLRPLGPREGEAAVICSQSLTRTHFPSLWTVAKKTMYNFRIFFSDRLA